jgi:phenylpyruvate tautomerase PptA (4-oxalocrotonate tautomerase family)
MPFIHIKSLPFPEPRDIPAIVEGLCRDFARDTGVALKNVTATWEHFPPRQYAVAGRAVEHQPANSHPILVELVAPDFHPQEAIEAMLESVAASVASRARVPLENVFVSFRPAHNGRVFDAGSIIRW